jgi:hypothetical protein
MLPDGTLIKVRAPVDSTAAQLAALVERQLSGASEGAGPGQGDSDDDGVVVVREVLAAERGDGDEEEDEEDEEEDEEEEDEKEEEGAAAQEEQQPLHEGAGAGAARITGRKRRAAEAVVDLCDSSDEEGA